MSSGITRELLRLASPILVAQLALIANAAVDTAMAGRFSPADLAAVGIASSIMATVLMSLLSVLLALTPMIAHHYGAGNRAEVGKELRQSLWIALVIAVAAVLLLHYPKPFILLSHLQPEVEIKVRAYLDASAWSVPAVIALRLFFGFSTGIGRAKPVMIFNLISLGLKVALNAVFMYGLLGFPRMEGPGCAVATAVESWLMAAVIWRWCLNHPAYAEFELKGPLTAPSFDALWAFLRLGVPIGITFVADVTAFTFMALFIARLGPVYSAAHQIAANLTAVAFMIPLSLGNAISALAAQALGAKNRERARRICLRGIGLAMCLALAVSLFFWFAAPELAALYTSDANVRAVAIPLILLLGFYHLGDAIQAAAVNALRGYKKSGVPMIIYAVSLWGLGLGGGYLLGLTSMLGPARGVGGFWLAAIIGIWLTALSVMIYLDAVSRRQKSFLVSLLKKG